MTCDDLQVGQHQSLKGLHDHRHQGDGTVVIQSSDGGFLGNRDDSGALEQEGTSHSSRDLLRIRVKMGASWSAQT